MDPSIAKKTQDSLGKIIKKPPLTEKLLAKPPFRFLHDVMTSVIKTTGFMQGLYTEAEMNSENVKDKDSKVAFLQKAVDMVAAVTGKSLSVRPIKIVAGHEPEKTNELLQLLAGAINKNVDSDEYVRRVLSGDKGGKEEKKERSSKDRTKSADRRKNESDNKADKDKDEEKSKEKGERERPGDRGKSRGGDRDRHRDGDRESKTRDKSRDGRDERQRDKSRKSFPLDPEPKTTSQNSRKSLSRLPVPTLQKKDCSTISSNDSATAVGSGSSSNSSTSKSRQPHLAKSFAGGVGASSKTSGAMAKTNIKPNPNLQKTAKSQSVKCSIGNTGAKLEKQRVLQNSPGGDSKDKAADFKSSLTPVNVSDASEACSEGSSGGINSDLTAVTAASIAKSQGDGLLSVKDYLMDNAGSGGGMGTPAYDIRDQSKEKENESPARQNGEDKNETPPRLQRPSSAKGSRRRREGEQNGEFSEEEEEGGGRGEDEEEEEEGRDERRGREKAVKYGRRRRGSEDEEFQKEMAPSKEAMIGEGDLPPQISAARQLARPSSARPAPPRPKQEATESEPAMRLGGGQPANVIVDNGMDDEDDDENFLVEESAPPPPDLEQQPISKPTEEDDTEHGALVKKMLESKKELEGGSQTQQAALAKKTEIERPAMSDAQRRKQREQVQKEVEKLRASIQSLTRSANPLGKVMDYVQEDLDSMQQELDKWRQENAQLGLDLKREMNVTDRAVEPLKQQLTELERAIGDQLDQIAATKCQIIKNDVKMEKMLKSIAKS